MTRIERLIKTMGEEADRLGEFFDPMPIVKKYLGERDNRVAFQLIESQAMVAKAYASHFDREEVAPDTAESEENANNTPARSEA